MKKNIRSKSGHEKRCIPFWTGLFLGLIGILPAGCVTETVHGLKTPYTDQLRIRSDQDVHDLKPLLSRYNMDPPLGEDLAGSSEDKEADLFPPYHKFSRMRYLSDDGSVSVHYYLEAGTGGRVASLLVDLIPDISKITNNTARLEKNQVTVFPDFIKDQRRTAGVGGSDFSKYGQGGSRAACDLLIVKAEQGKLYDVEKTITRLVSEIPQIRIKVRVIEVALRDRMEFGIESTVYKNTSGKSFLNTIFEKGEDGEFKIDPGTGKYIYESGGWTTKFNTESFIVGGEDFYQGSIFNVSGIHNKLALDAFIELVQRTSDSQILSAPEITVLNGHKAVIETGVKVPVQEVKTKQNETWFQYKYENTGVKLVILPTLLMDETIQIEVNGEVTTTSGDESVETQGGTVNIPIFTTRNISNVVSVKDGEAFFLGGLLARSEIERVNKVPLLGDIPILGYLFKSKSTDLRETQIIFYIEPHIVGADEGGLYMPN
ncbi:MAG: type II and III secretion system protein [Planctomycetota bacterium]